MVTTRAKTYAPGAGKAPAPARNPRKRAAPATKSTSRPLAKRAKTVEPRPQRVNEAVVPDEDEDEEFEPIRETDEEAIRQRQAEVVQEHGAGLEDRTGARDRPRDMGTQSESNIASADQTGPANMRSTPPERTRLPDQPLRPAVLTYWSIAPEIRHMIHQYATPETTWQPIPGIRPHPVDTWIKAAWCGYFSEAQNSVSRQMRMDAQSTWLRQQRGQQDFAGLSINWATLTQLPRLLHMITSAWKMEQRWLQVHPRSSSEQRSEWERLADISSVTVDMHVDDYLHPARLPGAYARMDSLVYEGERKINLTEHKLDHLRYFLRTALNRLRDNDMRTPAGEHVIYVRVLLKAPERPMRHPWLNKVLQRDRDLVDVFHPIFRAFRSRGLYVRFSLIYNAHQATTHLKRAEIASMIRNMQTYLSSNNFNREDRWFTIDMEPAKAAELRLIDPRNYDVEY
ncbi:hypothetical protein ACN47E_008018 [Coniothyrium glycines]